MDALLNWHVATAVLSGAFAIAAEVIYIRDIIYGETRPNAVSFLLWTALQAIALQAQLDVGPSWPALFMALITLGSAVVTVLAAIGFGYQKYGRIEFYCTVLAVVAMLLLFLGDVVLAILFAIAGDFCAALPTWKKTLLEPHTESRQGWALMTIAAFFGVLSTERWDLVDIGFPMYLTVATGFTYYLASHRKYDKTVDTGMERSMPVFIVDTIDSCILIL